MNDDETTVVRDETLTRDLDADHVLRGRDDVRAVYAKVRRNGRVQWVHVTRWGARVAA